MKIKIILAFAFFSLLICGCNGCAAAGENNLSESDSKIITIANWNTQEFFDSVTDGNEYKEFQTKKNWDESKYIVRLDRLCSVIRELNADVFVLEEIENEAILYDISNRLIGDSWKTNERLAYSCFCKENGSSIGTAILSRYPIESVKTHSLDIRTQKEKQPSMRPVLEARIRVDDKELVVFGNHWKSKSGSAEETEIWRDWQESCVTRLLLKNHNKGGAFIVCGDLNRNANEFIFNSGNAGLEGNIIFRNAGFGETKNLTVYNPWFNEDRKYSGETGSYFYNDEWERIDHIISFGKAKITSFKPRNDGEWADEKGIPKKYLVYKGEGYSDHLPVMATVKIE